MANDITGTIEASKVALNPDITFEIEIYGVKGMVRISDKSERRPQYHFTDANAKNIYQKLISGDSYSNYLESIYPPGKMSLGLFVNLHLASQLNLLLNIRDEGVSFTETPDFSEAAQSQKVIDCAYRSAREGGKRIKI